MLSHPLKSVCIWFMIETPKSLRWLLDSYTITRMADEPWPFFRKENEVWVTQKVLAFWDFCWSKSMSFFPQNSEAPFRRHTLGQTSKGVHGSPSWSHSALTDSPSHAKTRTLSLSSPWKQTQLFSLILFLKQGFGQLLDLEDFREGGSIITVTQQMR